MQVPPEFVRRRVAQACLLLVALAALPSIVAEVMPSASPYVPPYLLTTVATFSGANALLVWRTQWLVAKLFPGQQLPTPLPFTAKERRSAAVSGVVGLLVTVALAIGWVRSLP
jgi:hypothetical protein